jgi:hypothetical protein
MKNDLECNKKSFPKGYWSKKGKPTQNALNMFFVYLSNRPNDWNERKGRHKEALQKTREYFEVDYGIECMLTWGINFGCKDSETSSERHHAMSLSYHDAKGMIGQGYHYSELKLVG